MKISASFDTKIVSLPIFSGYDLNLSYINSLGDTVSMEYFKVLVGAVKQTIYDIPGYWSVCVFHRCPTKHFVGWKNMYNQHLLLYCFQGSQLSLRTGLATRCGCSTVTTSPLRPSEGKIKPMHQLLEASQKTRDKKTL